MQAKKLSLRAYGYIFLKWKQKDIASTVTENDFLIKRTAQELDEYFEDVTDPQTRMIIAMFTNSTPYYIIGEYFKRIQRYYDDENELREAVRKEYPEAESIQFWDYAVVFQTMDKLEERRGKGTFTLHDVSEYLTRKSRG